MKFISSIVICSALVFASCDQLKSITNKSSAPKTDEEKIAYAIGQQIGGNMKSQGITVNTSVLAASIEDALAGRPSKLTQEEIQGAMTKMREGMLAKQEAAGKENKEKGSKYLEENKKKANVKTTASGLQYEVLAEGKGNSPKATDTVKVHYSGTLIDGTKFDSSYDRNEPAEFPVGGVIPGWTEALQLMKPGAKYKLAIPSDLAYGAHGRPGIPPNSVLVFEVELIEVKGTAKAKS